MLKLQVNKIVISLYLVGVSFSTPHVVASEISVEESAAKMFAHASLAYDRQVRKEQQGGYNDTVYNKDFSVLPRQVIKTTGRFKAFGLATLLYEDKSFIKKVGPMDVEFHPGIDIFGNVIEPVQMSCSTSKCGDAKCSIPSFISAVRFKKMMQPKK